MFSRFILSAFLGVSSIGITAHLSAASNDGSVPNEPSRFQVSLGSRAGNHPSSDQVELQSDVSRILMAQMIPASSCVTYAGPVCPLRVLLPVGAQCACYYPDGWLSGIAQ